MAVFALDGLAPRLPDGFSFVAESAAVIGNVVISQDVGIWFGAVLRGDKEAITVGPRSNIQDNSVLHTDMGSPLTIGADCTIGHKAMLHGCTIGDGSLIGMNATVLNGAVIGRHCLIGACALVTEGKRIPDNSLVLGAPGRIARQLDAAAAAGLLASAARYVANAHRFAAGLARVE